MKTALTDRAIKAMRPAAKAYDTHDAVVPGLSLNVLPSGVKRFVLLRRFPGSKHPTRRALGAYGELTLEAARAKARQWLELIARGIDPRMRWRACDASRTLGGPSRSRRWSRTTSALRSMGRAARGDRATAPPTRPSLHCAGSLFRCSDIVRSPS